MKRIVIIIVAVLFLAASVFAAVQTARLSETERTQLERFEETLLKAGDSLYDFKLSAIDSLYKNGMSQLYGAATAASLVDDEQYQKVGELLVTICNEYAESEDFPFYISALTDSIKRYDEDKSLTNLISSLEEMTAGF